MLKKLLILFGVWAISLSATAAQHFPITGVHTGIDNKTGARPLRRNIDDFQKDTTTWYEEESTSVAKRLLKYLGLFIFKHLLLCSRCRRMISSHGFKLQVL